MEDGLAEVQVVDGLQVVIRVVLLVIGRIEVEGIPVGIAERTAARANQILGFVILAPGRSLGGGHGRLLGLAGQEQLRAQRGRLGVIRLDDLLDVDVLHVPVVLVAREYVARLRLQLGHDVRAVVQQRVVVDAEILAHLLAKLAVAGHEADPGQQRLEVRAGIVQRVLQRVVVQRLDADVLPLALAVVVGLAVLQHVQHVRSLGRIRRIQYAVSGIHEVIRHGLGVLLTVGRVPHHARAQVERPHQAILRTLPALRQAVVQDAVVVVLHQRVDEVTGGRSGRIVQVVQRRVLAVIDARERLLRRLGLVQLRQRRRQAGCQHGQDQQHGYELLHVVSPPLIFRYVQRPFGRIPALSWLQ